ncbi:MAG: cytochrome c4 [Gammaproteobacteria bacterium]|nr:cytochrome c4 [Gammaproteobacteria bacterium]
MKKMFVTLVAMSALAVVGSVNAAGNKDAGKAKSAACAACHGADGNSAAAINPNLAGQSAAYMVKQLKEFKSKKRDNPTMFGMASGLSDQDMEDLAAYFASQKAKGGSADEKLVKKGQLIYRSGDDGKGLPACIGCHGPAGKGIPSAKFPSLAGQYADYTVTQLKAFSLGKRDNDAGKMMQTVAGKMNSADMKAVASYIQGLK